MSLINDALKRAKDAQQDAPAPVNSGPPLRPVETEILVRHGVGLGIPIILALVALLILFFVWQYAPRRNAARSVSTTATETQVRARNLPEPNSIQEAQTPSLGTAAAKTTQQPPQQAASQNSTAKSTTSEATASTASQPPIEPSTATRVETNGTIQGTNAVVAVSSEPAKPSLPKLQGIVFSRQKPSAVISGKTLFIGERIGSFRLVAIAQDSATLVSGGQTNVLTLEE